MKLLRFGIHATKQGLLQAVNYRDRAQHDDNCANNVQNRRYGGVDLTLIAMMAMMMMMVHYKDLWIFVDEESVRALAMLAVGGACSAHNGWWPRIKQPNKHQTPDQPNNRERAAAAATVERVPLSPASKQHAHKHTQI